MGKSVNYHTYSNCHVGLWVSVSSAPWVSLCHTRCCKGSTPLFSCVLLYSVECLFVRIMSWTKKIRLRVIGVLPYALNGTEMITVVPAGIRITVCVCVRECLFWGKAESTTVNPSALYIAYVTFGTPPILFI